MQAAIRWESQPQPRHFYKVRTEYSRLIEQDRVRGRGTRQRKSPARPSKDPRSGYLPFHRNTLYLLSTKVQHLFCAKYLVQYYIRHYTTSATTLRIPTSALVTDTTTAHPALLGPACPVEPASLVYGVSCHGRVRSNAYAICFAHSLTRSCPVPK